MTRSRLRLEVEALGERVMLSASPLAATPAPLFGPVWAAAPKPGTVPTAAPGGVALDANGLPVTWGDSMRSLKDAVHEIKALVDRQKAGDKTVTNKVLADRLSQIIDQRIIDENDKSARNEEAQLSKPFIDWFDVNRESMGGRFTNTIRNNTIGDEFALRAEWAWDLGVGRCDETQAIAYYIANEAGLPAVRLYYSGGEMEIGHAFVVIGMKPPWANQPRDTDTWAPDAYVVDGWSGRSFSVAEAQDSPWISAHGKNQIEFTTTEDNARVYALNQQFVRGRTFRSKTEEALEIVKARAAFNQDGINAEVQPAPTESGERIRGKVSVRLGKNYFANQQNGKPAVALEVLLSKNGSIVGRHVVRFQKGQFTAELTLGTDFLAYASLPTLATTLQATVRVLAANPAQCTAEFRSLPVTIRALAPRSDLEVRVVDDVTGQPISGVRVGVHREHLVRPVAGGDTDGKGSFVFKDLPTKDPAYLSVPTDNLSRYRYVVAAGKGGYVAAESDVVPAALAGQKQVVTIRLARAVTVHVKLTDYNGNFVGGGTLGGEAQLKVEGSDATYPVALGDQNDFVVKNVPATKNGRPLTYRVTGNCRNFVPTTVRYTYDGQSTEPEVTLQLRVAYNPILDVSGTWNLADWSYSTGYEGVRQQRTLFLSSTYTLDKSGGIIAAAISGTEVVTFTWSTSRSDGGYDSHTLTYNISVTGTIREGAYYLPADVRLEFRSSQPAAKLPGTVNGEYGGEGTSVTYASFRPADKQLYLGGSLYNGQPTRPTQPHVPA